MPASPSRSQTSVLIVDDDDFMRELIMEILEGLGVQHIESAANGRAAIQRLRQVQVFPSLLISDIYMPDMDGFEFISALADMGYPERVMLCSGVNVESLALAREVAEGLGLRLAGVYSKPLSAEILGDVLDKNGL